MGRLIRWMAAGLAALAFAVAGADEVAAFESFGSPTADSTYGEQMRFEVDLEGGAPDRLQLLLRFAGSDAATVVPVEASGDRATHVLDTSIGYVTPNTVVTYQWRAIEGEDAVLSTAGTLRYEDDRPGLDWESAQLGEATVHWYGGAESQARRFGELTAIGVERSGGVPRHRAGGTGGRLRLRQPGGVLRRARARRSRMDRRGGLYGDPHDLHVAGWRLTRLPRAGDDPRGHPRRLP